MCYTKKTLNTLFIIVLPVYILAQNGPKPGDIYKEYVVRLKTGNNWRVTDPDASHSGAQDFLPNPLLEIDIDDLEGAIRAEALMDIWGGHTGTIEKRLRFNENEWIDLPDHPAIENSAECYNSEFNYITEIPLEHLKTGENTFEGNSGGQTCYNFGWGQWGWYVMIVRIYYDESKPHPTGNIISPQSGSEIGEKTEIEIEASGIDGIEKIEFLAKYEGYDDNGDGIYYDWHYNYHSTSIEDHVGTIYSDDTSISWDTKMIPDQESGAVAIMARIKDKNGVYYVAELAENLTLIKPEGISVKMYKPTNVPQHFWVRADAKESCNVYVSDTTHITDAYIHHRTWNGKDGGAGSGTITTPLSLNEEWSGYVKGKDHDYAYTQVQIPVSNIKNGKNEISYHSDTEHHGIEILWPGPAIIIRYNSNAEQVAKPVISPEPGEYETPFNVSITCETPGVKILYTTKGTDPTVNSRQYTGPITVSEDVILKAKAYKFDHVASEIAESVFTKYFLPDIVEAEKGEKTNTIELTFNRPLDQTSAEEFSNYTLNNNGIVEGAQLDTSDSKRVILTVNGLIDKEEYTVTINNVADFEGTTIKANTTVTFLNDYFTEVTSSHNDEDYLPELTVDDDLSTFWAAEGTSDVWLKYDLKTQMIISAVHIAFYNGDSREYKLSIETSENNVDWTEVFNGTSSGITNELEDFDIEDIAGRYVRILGFGYNRPSEWNLYTEVKIDTELLSSRISKREAANVLVFPNPVKDKIYFDLKGKSCKNLQLIVYDISGKCIFQESVNNYDPVISYDLSGIHPGTYIYSLKTNNHTTRGIFVK